MQLITVRQKLEALDEQIIPLIREGMFLEWEIRIDDIEFYLVIRNQGTAQLRNEFYIGLEWESEFFEDESCVDSSCSADELIKYIEEFRSNPHQFVETYGY